MLAQEELGSLPEGKPTGYSAEGPNAKLFALEKARDSLAERIKDELNDAAFWNVRVHDAQRRLRECQAQGLRSSGRTLGAALARRRPHSSGRERDRRPSRLWTSEAPIGSGGRHDD